MKTRGILIAGNWKMNLGPKDTEKYFGDLKALWGPPSGNVRACLIPPALSLQAALQASRGMPVSIAAQNAHWEKSGAFTGELSGPMLQEAGIKTVLIGHSERRQYFGETNETARKRSQSLLEQGFQVILCIGETRAERESGKTQAVLTEQLRGSLPEVGYLDGRLVLAYEPVWAIGTGLTATPAQAEEAHQMIRKFLWDQHGMEASGRTPILYGGSVTPENVDSLLSCPNIDGALVGGASLKPDSFVKLLESGGKVLGSK